MNNNHLPVSRLQCGVALDLPPTQVGEMTIFLLSQKDSNHFVVLGVSGKELFIKLDLDALNFEYVTAMILNNDRFNTIRGT